MLASNEMNIDGTNVLEGIILNTHQDAVQSELLCYVIELRHLCIL